MADREVSLSLLRTLKRTYANLEATGYSTAIEEGGEDDTMCNIEASVETQNHRLVRRIAAVSIALHFALAMKPNNDLSNG